MKTIKNILIIVLILAIVIPLIVRGISNWRNKENNSERSHKEKRENQTTPAHRVNKDGTWKVVSPAIRISYNGEYGEAFKGVLPGDNISIEDLTEPVCIKTKSGKEYCSNGTEDFEENIIPVSSDNSELSFVSQNKKTGYLNIWFWVPNN